MVAAGRDLGSLLTQMKQKPAVVQRALDSHKQSFSISQFAQIKNRQRTLENISHHILPGFNCGAFWRRDTAACNQLK